MLKIWGNADSINVQKVLWCCEELHLAYQRLDAGRHFGAVDTPAFRKLNARSLVPTIEDDGPRSGNRMPSSASCAMEPWSAAYHPWLDRRNSRPALAKTSPLRPSMQVLPIY